MRVLAVILALLVAVAWGADDYIAATRTSVSGHDFDTQNEISRMPYPLYTNCVLWMPFSHNNGTNYYDFSVKRWNGYSTNVNQGPTWSTNGYGAQTFDMTNDTIIVPDDDALDLTELTMTAWIKPSGWGSHASGLGRILAHGSSVQGYQFGINKDYGSLTNNIFLTTTNANIFSQSMSITLSVWQHVAVTYAGTTAVFYVNSVNKGTGYGYPLNAIAGNLHIGSTFSATYTLFFGGIIDDVRLYNRALTASEVGGIYTNTLRGHP